MRIALKTKLFDDYITSLEEYFKQILTLFIKFFLFFQSLNFWSGKCRTKFCTTIKNTKFIDDIWANKILLSKLKTKNKQQKK